MQWDTLLDAAKDFVSVALMLCGLGLFMWWDLLRQERNRREWLRVNNYPVYRDMYGDDDEEEDLDAEETYRETGFPVGEKETPCSH